jgi:5'-methylthioadenosine phosphorylase
MPKAVCLSPAQENVSSDGAPRIYYVSSGTWHMPPPVHILAEPGDIAEIAVTSGDPARIEQLAKMLRDAKLVNSNRGFTTYTGYYGKKRMTLATHGIGGPSTAIVFEELYMLGAKTIIRFGTAGGLISGLEVGDFVIPTGAAHSEGSLRAYVDDGSLPAVPDFGLTNELIQTCRRAHLRHREGLVYSSDSFYSQDLASLERWVKRGVLAVEMECATLFTLGLLRGFKTAALLMLSNSLVNKSESDLAPAQQLRPYAAKGALAIFDAVTRSQTKTRPP